MVQKMERYGGIYFFISLIIICGAMATVGCCIIPCVRGITLFQRLTGIAKRISSY
jgi:hypothetical protein